MSQGFYGFPNILGLLRATNLRVTGKAGATAGAGLAGGTTSGAPTSGGPFELGDVVAGQDGTLWICTTAGTSGSAPGTFTQVIAGSVSGQLASAHGGTGVDASGCMDGQVLVGQSSDHSLGLATLSAGSGISVTNSGHGIAVAATGSGAGGTGLTQIATTTVGVGGASSVDFSSIPGSFSALWLHLYGASNQAVTAETVSMQFNSDTTGNYDWGGAYESGSGGSALQECLVAQTSGVVMAFPGTSSPANALGVALVVLPGYAQTTFRKGWTAHTSGERGTTNTSIVVEVMGGFWRSTAAITAIHLFPAAGTFVQGSTFVLYGIS